MDVHNKFASLVGIFAARVDVRVDRIAATRRYRAKHVSLSGYICVNSSLQMSAFVAFGAMKVELSANGLPFNEYSYSRSYLKVAKSARVPHHTHSEL